MDKSNKINMVDYQGVILGKTPRDYVLGSQIEQEVNCDNWEFYLIDKDWKIEHEHQMYLYKGRFGFETFACTCFSGNDVKELIMMWALHNNKVPASHARWLKDNGYFRNGAINFDDRVPAMFSEITNFVGTYQWKAGNALRKWSLPEGILKDDPKDWNEYMDKGKLTQEAEKLQAEYDKRFLWHWFWFRDDQDIDEQLKTSPSMSIVRFANGEGCLSPTGQFNHAIMEYGKDEQGCRKIDDSYNQQLKKYKPTHITSRMGFKLTILKDMNSEQFLTDNDLKAVWNKDSGSYYYVHQKALKKYDTKDRAVLMLVEDKFRKDGKVVITNEMLEDLPVLQF
jgi:hypothetical protein